jgi:hypothetical protein
MLDPTNHYHSIRLDGRGLSRWLLPAVIRSLELDKRRR